MQVVLEGQEQLFANLKRFQKKAVAEDAMEGLKKAGMNIIADAQENLRRDNINTTGRLSQSGKVQEVRGEQAYDVGFMSGDANYATYLEYGTKAHWVSIKWLLPWVRKKMFTGRAAGVSAAVFARKNKEQLAESTAYAVQRGIARKGTKAHPFFVPAVKKHEKEVVNEISRAIKKTIDSYGV